MCVGGVVALVDHEVEIIAGVRGPLEAEINAEGIGEVVVLPEQAELQVGTEGVADAGAARAHDECTAR